MTDQRSGYYVACFRGSFAARNRSNDDNLEAEEEGHLAIQSAYCNFNGPNGETQPFHLDGQLLPGYFTNN